MRQGRLNDAAFALYRVLRRNGIQFGIFGGYAVRALGGFRDTKDIDCIASIDKKRLVSVLDGKDGFTLIPHTRNDYVAFLWSEMPPVLVEVFCEQFPGAQYTMENVQTLIKTFDCEISGVGVSLFLDPFLIFKGKLRAAAMRSKFTDAVDLRFLESQYRSLIHSRKDELDLFYVELAVIQHPDLIYLFRRIEVDLNRATEYARDLDPTHLPPPGPGDVQRGLLK